MIPACTWINLNNPSSPQQSPNWKTAMLTLERRIHAIPYLTTLAFSLCVVAGTVIGAATAFAQAKAIATYSTAEDAVAGLVAAVRSEDSAADIVKVLGSEGEDIATSGDPVDDEARRERFLTAFDEAHKIDQQEPEKFVLVIGKDEYPFPIPITSKDGKWFWDTGAGINEILTRRIGENELNTIQVMRTYVAAQLEYAEKERDGKGIQYARRLMSREGRKDGLYWAAAEGEEVSPIGPLIAKAQSEGYKAKSSGEGQPAYHGYIFRMLYGQSRNAADGARDYIVNDRMIGGFALIATPADYGNSGIMTFIVNHDGDVYEQDLGLDTPTAARRIKLFDPDSKWKKVDTE
jgi:hypothetical protein